MRVYGALMWSLGKVINTPEVSRVYIGSFWDQPYLFDEQRGLFEAEQEDLFKDLQCIPRGSATRKLNDLIRRCRMIRVSCCCLFVCLFTLVFVVVYFRYMHIYYQHYGTKCRVCLAVIQRKNS